MTANMIKNINQYDALREKLIEYNSIEHPEKTTLKKIEKIKKKLTEYFMQFEPGRFSF